MNLIIKNLANLDSYTVTRKPLPDERRPNKKHDNAEMEKNSYPRIVQTLQSCIKVSLGNNFLNYT